MVFVSVNKQLRDREFIYQQTRHTSQRYAIFRHEKQLRNDFTNHRATQFLGMALSYQQQSEKAKSYAIAGQLIENSTISQFLDKEQRCATFGTTLRNLRMTYSYAISRQEQEK